MRSLNLFFRSLSLSIIANLVIFIALSCFNPLPGKERIHRRSLLLNGFQGVNSFNIPLRHNERSLHLNYGRYKKKSFFNVCEIGERKIELYENFVLKKRRTSLTFLSFSQKDNEEEKSSDIIPKNEDMKEEVQERKRPLPAVGDIVTYTDKWENDYEIGQIKFLQQINGNDWIVDVSPLKEIGENLYRFEKKAKYIKGIELVKVKPLSSFYIRSTDAYRITTKLNKETGKKEPKLLHPEGYQSSGDLLTLRILESQAKMKKPFDKEMLVKAKNDYENIKKRLLTDTTLFGVLGTLLALYKAGSEDATIFASGVIASCGYLFLLSLKADAIGLSSASVSPSSSSSSSPRDTEVTIRRANTLANLRFAFPVFLLIGLTVFNYSNGDIYMGGNPATSETENLRNGFNFLKTVRPDQFWSAMLGFLSYRVPMFVREIASAMDRAKEDLAKSGLPKKGKSTQGLSTIGVGLKFINNALGKDTKEQENDNKEGYIGIMNVDGEYITRDEQEKETTIILLSGPSNLNKRLLAKKLVKEDVKDRFMEPIWTTTREPKEGEVDGVDFNFWEDYKFQYNREQSKFLFTYKDESKEAKSNDWYGLREEDIYNIKKEHNKIVVLTLDPYQADKLLTFANTRIIGLWLTCKKADQFRHFYQDISKNSSLHVKENLENEKKLKLTNDDSKIETAIKEATKAIEHALMGEMYEFNIYLYNDSDEGDLSNQLEVSYANEGKYYKGEKVILENIQTAVDFALSLSE